jgi:hypothetical protein
MNNKKREIVEREGLENDEEDVEDHDAMGHTDDILHTTYERKTIGHVSSGNSSRSESSTSSSQVYTLRGGSSITNFTMERQDPTIRLLEFRGDGSNDLENHLFICEKI